MRRSKAPKRVETSRNASQMDFRNAVSLPKIARTFRQVRPLTESKECPWQDSNSLVIPRTKRQILAQVAQNPAHWLHFQPSMTPKYSN